MVVSGKPLRAEGLPCGSSFDQLHRLIQNSEGIMHVNAHILNSHEGVVKQFAKWKTEHHSASSDRRLPSPLIALT
jgi:hypothetical protein